MDEIKFSIQVLRERLCYILLKCSDSECFCDFCVRKKGSVDIACVKINLGLGVLSVTVNPLEPGLDLRHASKIETPNAGASCNFKDVGDLGKVIACNVGRDSA